MKSVAVDPGHGGLSRGDSGFAKHGGTFWELDSGDILYEKDIVKSAGFILSGLLEYRGIDVTMTRGRDEFISLTDRCRLANQAGVDAFVSLHVNYWKTPNAKGTTVFRHENSTGGDRLADSITAELDKFKPIDNRGEKLSDSDIDDDREPYYRVLDKTAMPAVLIEMGFISNENDRKVLMDNMSRLTLVSHIWQGIMNWGEE